MPLTTSSHSQSAVVDRRIRIKAVNLAAGGGTLLAEAGTASTLGGAITGVGAWTKAGPGTLTLTGANTYSGGQRSAQGRCSSVTEERQEASLESFPYLLASDRHPEVISSVPMHVEICNIRFAPRLALACRGLHMFSVVRPEDVESGCEASTAIGHFTLEMHR